MDLADVAHELYALPLAEFTAARNARAKRARSEGQPLLAKQIAKLPKPSTAAWAVNVLARRRGEELGQVLDLGASLREAQADLDPAAMRALGRERSRLLAAVVRDGREAAGELGVKVSDAAAEEMEQTLHAAMADPQAAEAVRSGLLVRTLTGSGLEPVDLAGAVAVPGALPEPAAPSAAQQRRARQRPARGAEPEGTETPRTRRPDADADARARERAQQEAAQREAEQREAEESRRREREQAETDLADAEQGLAESEAELADAQAQADTASARRNEIADELDRLRRRIDELEEDLAAAEREDAHADRARRLASRLAEQGRRAVQRARDRLAQLP
ncbi:transposase [Sinomonas sp. B1-1]|uniref:transposase n=1 Tax=Sinomonas sp. B1-1 TaxID=3141454 RepID=UPI003D2BB77F